MKNLLRCAECGAAIYSWEETFRWPDGRWLCGECFDELVSELDRMEKAELLGCRVAFAEEV